MQAIVTRFVGPRDHDLNSYVIARADAGRVRVQWDDRATLFGNHARACRALCTKLDWRGRWIMGSLPEKLPRWAFTFTCADHRPPLEVVRHEVALQIDDLIGSRLFSAECELHVTAGELERRIAAKHMTEADRESYNVRAEQLREVAKLLGEIRAGECQVVRPGVPEGG